MDAYMTAETPSLPSSLLESALAIEDAQKRTRWYMCVIISLSSMNYPDVIPQVFSHCVENHLPSLESAKARLSAIQQIREGLIKSTGIVGAARTGTAMRTLAKSIPEEYRETTMHSPRATESVEHARERGRKFWSNIYSRNRVFDPEATVKASPDYAFIVRDLLYGHIFSFDGVIDPLTTGYAVVSALYGLDCQNQLQHHMKGMLINGASYDDLVELQTLCLGIAKHLDVRFRHGPAPIPEKPEA